MQVTLGGKCKFANCPKLFWRHYCFKAFFHYPQTHDAFCSVHVIWQAGVTCASLTWRERARFKFGNHEQKNEKLKRRGKSKAQLGLTRSALLKLPHQHPVANGYPFFPPDLHPSKMAFTNSSLVLWHYWNSHMPHGYCSIISGLIHPLGHSDVYVFPRGKWQYVS